MPKPKIRRRQTARPKPEPSIHAEDRSEIERVVGVALQRAQVHTENTLLRQLFVCPQCAHIWFLDELTEEPRPDAARVAALARELDVDPDPATLARAHCSICTVGRGIGSLTVDYHDQGVGCGISWEGVVPTGAHLLGSVFDWEGVNNYINVQGRTPPVVFPARPVDAAKLRAVVTGWQQMHIPTLQEYTVIGREETARLAMMNRPGHGAPGAAHLVWKGATWKAPAPGLCDGPALYGLNMALAPDEPLNVAEAVRIWRGLATLLAAGTFYGGI